MATILTKMLTGEIACEKIYEDARVAAVLEPAPLSPGHAFVFPKREAESWLALEPAELAEVLAVARRVAEAIARAFPCRRVALAAYGVKTPHAHFHLIPVNGAAGEIDLTRARPAADPAQLRADRAKIATYLNS
jgi:histidine triad (HIT) family protein